MSLNINTAWRYICGTAYMLYILLHLTDSGILMRMPDSTEEAGIKQNNSKVQVKEDSEYVRLVVPNELRTHETYAVSPTQPRKRSSIWWIKAIIWSSITIILLLVFVKYVVPFLVEKVLQFHFLVENLSVFICMLALNYDDYCILDTKIFKIPMFHK